jgi:chromate transporter
MHGWAWQVLRTSLRLGLTSFGGPVAHLGYFERTYVRQRQWLNDEEYGSLMTLCQTLPGPASSQLGFLIGLHRAGWLGAFTAWLGFTLPSALLLYGCAVLSKRLQGPFAQAGLHGLKLVAVAVVAQAVWTMARALCPDRVTTALALTAALLLLIVGGSAMQLLALAVGAAGGMLLCRRGPVATKTLSFSIGHRTAVVALSLFLLLLFGLPILASQFPHTLAELAAIFFRAGALVFGGGHVVLPLLRDALVPGGWITDDRFLTGYGLAQAIPGPLFTFAAYVGASNAYMLSPALGGLVATVFIFTPGLLLAVAGASLWSHLLRYRNLRAALAGVNAAVVGILGAALYDPVWTSAIRDGTDAAIAITGVMLLQRWAVAPVVVLVWCVMSSGVRAVL